MKGFKDKSGKFRPTGNKTKSSLKKSDLKKRSKESFCNTCGSRLQTGQACKTCQAIKNIEKTPEFKSGMSGADVAQLYRSQGKVTDLGLDYKKTLDKNRNKEELGSEECTRCKGTGTRNGVAFCYRCMGTGQKKRDKLTVSHGEDVSTKLDRGSGASSLEIMGNHNGVVVQEVTKGQWGATEDEFRVEVYDDNGDAIFSKNLGEKGNVIPTRYKESLDSEKSKHGIAVRDRKTGELIDFIETGTGRQALRVLSGIRINMGSDYKASEEMVSQDEIAKVD